MKQEDKELLLKDLCARLPYGVKCKIHTHVHGDTVYKLTDIRDNGYTCGTVKDKYAWAVLDISEVKPYLFPLSSITEKQKKEYYSLADDVTIKPGQGCYLGIKIHCIKLGISDNPHEEVWDYINLDALDWLNKNHFDYRGLIEKGLAIDATRLNIY